MSLSAVVVWIIKRRIKVALFKKLKEKLGAGAGSATVGVAGAIVAVGVGMQTVPAVDNIVRALTPDSYEGMVVAALGLIVAIARFRTLGKQVK